MPSIRSTPLVPGDPGLAAAIKTNLDALGSGVLNTLPNSMIDLLRQNLIVQTALLLAICDRMEVSGGGEGPEGYISAAADLLAT